MSEVGAASGASPPQLLSPPRLPSSQGKERRQASITPRKFRRFFTPRSRVSSAPSEARLALHDLTVQALNRSQTPPSSPLKPEAEHNGLVSQASPLRNVKRRKLVHTLDPPPWKLPVARPAGASLSAAWDDHQALRSPIESLSQTKPGPSGCGDGNCEVSNEHSGPGLPRYTTPKKIVRLAQRGLAGQLLQRQLGSMLQAGHHPQFPVVGEKRNITRRTGDEWY